MSPPPKIPPKIPMAGTLVLLGAGKMGGAMLQGWLSAGIDPAQIVVLDPYPSAELSHVLGQHGIRLNPPTASLVDVSVIVVAVKPQSLDDVLSAMKSVGQGQPLVISIVAGKTIATFAKYFGPTTAIIRTIPNTPAAIGRGVTAMAANAHVSADQMQLADVLLASIGEVVTLENETQIDAATAVSGSGPAYVFYMTECLAAAGQAAGLAPDIAMKLARATVAGSGELMRQTGTDAEQLRKNVTSPNGTTHAALQVLMASDGLKPLMQRAVAAAEARARELGSA